MERPGCAQTHTPYPHLPGAAFYPTKRQQASAAVLPGPPELHEDLWVWAASHNHCYVKSLLTCSGPAHLERVLNLSLGCLLRTGT